MKTDRYRHQNDNLNVTIVVKRWLKKTLSHWRPWKPLRFSSDNFSPCLLCNLHRCSVPNVQRSGWAGTWWHSPIHILNVLNRNMTEGAACTFHYFVGTWRHQTCLYWMSMQNLSHWWLKISWRGHCPKHVKSHPLKTEFWSKLVEIGQTWSRTDVAPSVSSD